MISYEMGLYQLTSNKCMILMELYLLIQSVHLGIWGPNYIFQWRKKYFSKAFFLLNMKSSLLKPDL